MQRECTSTHRITSIIRRMVKRFQCFEQFAEMFLSWTGATLKINFNESTEYIKIIASRYCLVKCASIVKAPKNNAWQTWCSFVKYMAEDMHISLYFPLFVHTDSRKKGHPVNPGQVQSCSLCFLASYFSSSLARYVRPQTSCPPTNSKQSKPRLAQGKQILRATCLNSKVKLKIIFIKPCYKMYLHVHYFIDMSTIYSIWKQWSRI